MHMYASPVIMRESLPIYVNSIVHAIALFTDLCCPCGFLQVKLEMYMEYFKTIGMAFILPILFLYVFQQAASLTYNYWLSLWADDPIVNGTQLNTDLKLGGLWGPRFCAG